MWKDTIRITYQSLTRQQKQAADYLLKDDLDVWNLTIREMAANAEIGQPTIIRMLQNCGYKSWSDFLRETLKEHGRQESLIITEGIEKVKYRGRHKAVIRSLTDDMALLSELASKLDLFQLDEVARVIKHANIIDVYGTDNSANAATELAGRLLHLGLTSRNYSDLFFQKISAGHLGKKDVAIGFSISGETTAVIQALHAAKDSGAITVAVTGDRKSSLTQGADYVFITPTRYYNDASKWIASRITQVAFVDAICTAIITSDEDRFQGELQKSSQEFREDISESAR